MTDVSSRSQDAGAPSESQVWSLADVLALMKLLYAYRELSELFPTHVVTYKSLSGFRLFVGYPALLTAKKNLTDEVFSGGLDYPAILC